MDRINFCICVYAVFYDHYRARFERLLAKAHGVPTALLIAALFAAQGALGVVDLEIVKSVDNPHPAPGNPVEFTVTVTNLGDEPAGEIVVSDLLPDTLEIPAGLATFTSQGQYTPENGEWQVGQVNEGMSASLLVPAMVAAGVTGGCVVNSATIDSAAPADAASGNDVAAAAVYVGDVASCYDVSVDVTAFLTITDECQGTQWAWWRAEVVNLGPDPVTDVDLVVALTENGVSRVIYDETIVCADATAASCAESELEQGASTVVGFGLVYDRAVSLVVTGEVSGPAPDGNVANDTMTARLAVPAVARKKSACPTLGGGGGGGFAPGCFIATAAYGSWLDPHVVVLQGFRDRYLVTNSMGRSLVQFYYRTSPPIAEFIGRHSVARAAVRMLLAPVVYAIVYPKTLILLVLAIFVIFVTRRRRARP